MTAATLPPELSGRTALVTGSSRGIGFAIALGLARAGADVVINARDSSNAERARDELLALLGANESDAAPIRVDTAVFDVVDAGAVRSEVQRLEAASPIDILVNNAGIQRRAPLVDLALDDWRAVLEVNLTGPFVVSQAVAPAMIARGRGAILNICSVQTSLVRPTTSAYAASKAGLAGLTRAMCVEWAASGLQVNGLAPGYLATELNAALVDDPVFSDWITGRTPARRWGSLDDIVGPAVWLCSDAARFVNGQVVYADGGITAAI